MESLLLYTPASDATAPDSSLSDRAAEYGAARDGEVRLADLADGARAIVQRVDASAPIAQRLADLGFLPGTEVRVERRAPLGDPVVYELRGYRLCLRRCEAASIHVRPLPDRPGS